MFRIKKGLDLPLVGVPKQEIQPGKSCEKIGLIGGDYVGMRPSMCVRLGDQVAIGQALFSCKKSPGVVYTSPASGKVVEINRGERRAFQSLVIAQDGRDHHVEFDHYKSRLPEELESEEIRSLLIESGFWTALRTRPYSKVPKIDSCGHSLFINAMDTNPLSPQPEYIIAKFLDNFHQGLKVLSRLMKERKIYLCRKKDSFSTPELENLECKYFSGKHPAGLSGTHIHFVDPVGPNKTVWFIGYQDVIAIGSLFDTGRIFCNRIISLAGPRAKEPRLLETQLGVDIGELARDECHSGQTRVVSGSVFNGTTGKYPLNFLGRYHNQVTLLHEDNNRTLLGWKMPGFDKFSVKHTFAGSLLKGRLFPLGTNTQGSKRAMIPIGSYEKVMPLDILATQLLRSLVTRDTELAQQLGCLELDEEDLALCTFADPGKKDFGIILRDVLDMIERDG